MRYLKQLPWIFSLAALLFSTMSFFRLREEENLFAKKIFAGVRSCIRYNSEMPQKEEMYALIDRLEADCRIVESGNDDLRVKYVNMQGCCEHVLACTQALGEIDQLIGVIHTPMPATPLCVRPEGGFQDVLDESIRHNLEKLLTVRSRAQIVREYLVNGGKLYVAYPKGGLEKRSAEQQAIYREELDRYAGKLIDVVLHDTKIDPDMVGATYLFRNSKRQVFSFSIKSRQANDIQSLSEWGLWFGPVGEKEVAARVNEVFDYLASAGAPDPRIEI